MPRTLAADPAPAIPRRLRTIYANERAAATPPNVGLTVQPGRRAWFRQARASHESEPGKEISAVMIATVALSAAAIAPPCEGFKSFSR